MQRARFLRSELFSSRRFPLFFGLFMFLMLLWSGLVTTITPPSSAQNIYSPTTAGSRTGTPAPSRVPSSVSQSVPSVKLSDPRSVPGQPQWDGNTVALYHFDSPSGNKVIDATGRYTGTLEGNATISTSGLYAGVLTLDGLGSYVRIGNVGSLGEGTVEMFVDFANVCDSAVTYSSLISAGSEYGGGTNVMQLGASTFFDIYASGHLNRVDSGVNPCRYLIGSDQWQNFYNWGLDVKWPYETWRFHHIAGTWGPRGMEVWLNGVLYGVGYQDTPPPPYIYYCNPQYYVSSPYYPWRCPFPLPAPEWTPFPDGDYTGGLPSYNTILIGCNSSGGCFKGRIDEVRISNVQRTFDYRVVPTVTPIPTQTPVPIVGAYGLDSSTQALYHLDSFVPCVYSACVLNEASGQAEPAMGAIVPNGHFNSALSSASNGLYIQPMTLGYFQQGTVEAWLKLSTGAVPQSIFSTPYNTLTLGANANAPFYFSMYGDGERYPAMSGVAADALAQGGCWRHVAGTWGPRGVEIWIDGTLRAINSSYTGGMVPPEGWLIGSNYSENFTPGNAMQGILDEVRVSSVQRTFSPRTLSARLNSSSGRSPADSGWLAFLPWISVAPTPAFVCPFGN